MDEYFELQEKHDAMPIGDEKAQIAKVLDALWDEMESAIDKDREPIYAECGWTGVEWLIEECNRSDSQNSSR